MRRNNVERIRSGGRLVSRWATGRKVRVSGKEVVRRATPQTKAVAKKAAKKAAAKKVPAKKAAAKKAAKKAPAKKVAAKKAAKKAPAKKAAPNKAAKPHQPSNGTRPKLGLPELPAPPTDPAEVLGLCEPFDDSALRRAWRTFAARHHPDQGGDAVTFTRGRRAYDELRRRPR